MDLNFNWHEKAACYLLYPAVDFFTGSHEEAAELIDTYCKRCPVIRECAADAVSMAASAIPAGVYGGVYMPSLGGHHGKHWMNRREAFNLMRERAMLKHRDDAA